MIHIFDILGIYCGMHYYDIAFADIFREKGLKVRIYSNFGEKGNKAYFPLFFKGFKIKRIFFLLWAYLKYFYFIITHINDKVIYLTYGELYEIPFLLISSISKNAFIDVHEVHALKYADNSKIAKFIEYIYRKRVRNVIYHSDRTYNILKGGNINMLFVPHFKYVFKKEYNKENLSKDIRESFANKNIKKFLFFGNLSTVKGVDVVVDVFTHLTTTDYELVIAGKNVENINFHNIRSQNIKVFDRHINDDELVFLYSNTDYILLPYRKSSQSGIFAMAAYFHKPMILSDIPYFSGMLSEFPSFGVKSSLATYGETILKLIEKDCNSYYQKEDCEKFEMKGDIESFLSNYLNYYKKQNRV